MGAACGKSSDAASPEEDTSGGTLGVMFRRFDKDKKGYISKKDLNAMMADEKNHFQGKDADYIISKYGSDGKMNIDQFGTWWNSTYTTYNETDVANMVAEVQKDQAKMETINEAENIPLPGDQHITNKAVGRS